jgi:hypothetical protein
MRLSLFSLGPDIRRFFHRKKRLDGPPSSSRVVRCKIDKLTTVALAELSGYEY